MGAGQEVSQVNEFAVVLVLDVNDAPAVLTAANLLAVDDNVLLAPDNSKRNDVLQRYPVRQKKAKPLTSRARTLIWTFIARSSSSSSSLS